MASKTEPYMTTILEVNKLLKRFAGFTAVNEVSFKVETGTCFGLLGPNGAGKTTTIEMLEGILAPTAGHILYQGRPIKKRDFQRLRYSVSTYCTA